MPADSIDPVPLAAAINHAYDGPLVEGEIAFWDQQSDDERRRSYFCRACQQSVPKDDLAAIFHHHQRGHKRFRDGQSPPPEKSLSEQLTEALDRALRTD